MLTLLTFIIFVAMVAAMFYYWGWQDAKRQCLARYERVRRPDQEGLGL